MFLPSLGFPIQASRTYNSHDKFSGPLGYGWVFNYGIKLYSTSDSTNHYAVIKMPNGQRYKFKDLGGGSFQSPISIWDSLKRNPDGTYTLKMKGGEQTFHFSAEGNLTSIEDESGNALYITYDSYNQLERVDNGLGRYIDFSFYPNGKISQIQDNLGKQVSYTYDGYGNLSTFTDPESRTTTYKYESLNPRQEHFMTSIEDNWGRVVTQIEYYTNHKVKSYTEKGETYTYIYPSSSQTSGITSKRDSSNKTWVITFDSNGVITQTKDPYSETKTFTYDADYNLTQMMDEMGVRTSYAYESGKITQLTRAFGTTEAVTWDYTYDENFPEKIKEIQAPSDYQSTEYEYYPPGGPSEGLLHKIYRIQTDGSTKDLLTTYAYNDEGQITSVTNALGKTTTYQYDTVGDLVSVTYPRNSDTGPNPAYFYTYDDLGRVETITDPLGNTTSYTYDNLGRVMTLDAKGKVTEFVYDKKKKIESGKIIQLCK